MTATQLAYAIIGWLFTYVVVASAWDAWRDRRAGRP